MAQGDVWFVYASLANNATLDLKDVSAAILIQNLLTSGGKAELYATDGTSDTLQRTILPDTEGNAVLGVELRAKPSGWFYRLKNVSGGTLRMGGDGVKTDNA